MPRSSHSTMICKRQKCKKLSPSLKQSKERVRQSDTKALQSLKGLYKLMDSPKYELETSSRFEKQYKKLSQAQKLQAKSLINRLLYDLPLEPKHKDHKLIGNYSGYRECHIMPDLLLVYKKDKKRCYSLAYA